MKLSKNNLCHGMAVTQAIHHLISTTYIFYDSTLQDKTAPPELSLCKETFAVTVNDAVKYTLVILYGILTYSLSIKRPKDWIFE